MDLSCFDIFSLFLRLHQIIWNIVQKLKLYFSNTAAASLELQTFQTSNVAAVAVKEPNEFNKLFKRRNIRIALRVSVWIARFVYRTAEKVPCKIFQPSQVHCRYCKLQLNLQPNYECRGGIERVPIHVMHAGCEGLNIAKVRKCYWIAHAFGDWLNVSSKARCWVMQAFPGACTCRASSLACCIRIDISNQIN